MGAHPARRASRLRQIVVTVTGMAVAGAFIAYGGAATAAPSPTTNQVKQNISKLMSQLDAVAQQYDQSISELNSASARLTTISRKLGKAQRNFEAMRVAIAQIASAAYEQGGFNSATAMLASDDPQTVLDRADMLSHLSNDRRAQMSAFISAARTLRESQQTQQRTKTAITQLKMKKAAQRRHLRQLLAKNQAELRKLTAPPPPTTTSSGGGGLTYSGPATGAARVAVQYALSKIGDPYVWGAAVLRR